VALRFGDGTTSVGFRQTEVGYCTPHVELVKSMFVTCDERSLVATCVATAPVSPSPDLDKAPR
jgi:hypothetical protein